ncbi:MAG: sugar porter family MFS transporter [Neisseriaceae bacterium]
MSNLKINSNANALVIRVSIIAALAGLLFGLDVAYVNGTLDFIAKEFGLDVADSGKVAGYLLAGAATGALFSGWLSRVFGRKKVLVLAAIVFTGSIIFTITTHTFSSFLIGRFITGLAVGIASFVAPLYLSEISPFKVRGGLIAMYQLMITIGIFLMFISNHLLSFTGSWRIMLAVLLIPSIIMLLGTLTLPESPRWSVLKGQPDKALKILEKIRTTRDEVEFEMAEIKSTLANKSSSLKTFTQGYFLKVVILGIFLQALQQFSGMNAFMYYSEKIFATAGFINPSASTIIVGLVNVITTLIAIKFVDKLGRKPILYAGLTILVISCLTVGYLFNIEAHGVALSQTQQYTLLVFCLLFIFGFAVSLGPIIWIVCSEIFPLEVRDLGITITTMANWIFNTIIGSYTLVWFSSIGVGQTFYMFGGACLLGFVLVKVFTPETKSITLEELEINLKSGKKLRSIGS